MGQHAVCPKCFFVFWGGHSHHSGSSRAICTSCLSEFSLRTENPWGPRVGERIELVLVVTVERRPWLDGKVRNSRVSHKAPTGVFLTTVAGERDSVGDWSFELVEYPIGDIPCPQCTNTSLIKGFAPGDRCPQCARTELRLSRVIY